MELIIINQAQFGYHIDTYYYCKYLKDDFGIVYICWNHGLPKIEMDGVRVVYVGRKGNILVRTMRFLRQALGQINDNRTIVFIKYFKGISLMLRLLRPTNYFMLDLRTGSVHKSLVVRRFYDAWLKFEARFFRHVTVISQSLAEKLNIAHKAHILPLGADVISSTNKNFEELHLLYVGTLSNRNIDVTIHGFKQFYDEFEKQVAISYTIIGTGSNNEEQVLEKLVVQYGLEELIKITGRIPHTQLKSWFDGTNIGVSYVPITDYYDCQPMTKTFEYLFSGMPVIAANISENRRVIKPQNGVLVRDTAENFYSGLKEVFEKRQLFDSGKIRNKIIDHSWERIVKENVKPYIEKLAMEI